MVVAESAGKARVLCSQGWSDWKRLLCVDWQCTRRRLSIMKPHPDAIFGLTFAFCLALVATGLAAAPRFDELKNPIRSTADNLRDPSVLKTPDGYRLFYSRLAGKNWSSPDSWTIAEAFTKDFVHFEQDHDVSPKGHASPGDVVKPEIRSRPAFFGVPAALGFRYDRPPGPADPPAAPTSAKGISASPKQRPPMAYACLNRPTLPTV